MPEKKAWVPLHEWLQHKEEAAQTAYDKEVEMGKTNRKISVMSTGIGKGDPTSFGFSSDDMSNSARTRPALSEWKRLVDSTLKDPGEWYHRKAYYEDRSHTNSMGSFASLFNRGGTSNSKNDDVAKYVREALRTHGGSFAATYTRNAGPSDNPSKGPWMHMVFVRWIPGRKDED